MSAAVVSEKVESSTKIANVALWIVQIAVAGMFLMAGGAKLSGDPMMVGVFEKIGIGQWFRYLTGTLEVLGAIGLLTPFASGAAALGLVFVMIGAVASHLLILGGSPVSALVLLVASTGIAYGRRDQLTSLFGRIVQ
jgi:putative oxidoreductase